MSDQIPIDNLDAGDDSPKLARASLKDVVLAVNRISYTFKTPDDLVAPDALQLNEDGNLALGGAAKPKAGNGRHFWVMNNSTSGDGTAATNMTVESTSGLSFVNVKTTDRANGLRQWDGSSTTTPMVEMAWYPQEALWRQKIYNGTAQSTSLKIGNTGKVGLTEGSTLQALLNVGTVGATTANEIWVASNATTFEGAFLGAYDNRSGAKLDLNTQANATNVSSWRISHDLNDGGQGRLSFRFALANTSRAALSYIERMAITTGGLYLNGANRSVGGAPRWIQLENTSQASMSMVRNTNDVNGAVLALGKSRGPSFGGSAIVQNGDEIGNITFAAANGNNIDTITAIIQSFASGTQSATATPGALTISTSNASGAVVEALRVTNQQNVSLGGSSDVSKLVLIKGVTYPSGEGMLYLQTTNPGTTPAMIIGSSSGTTQISGGSPLATGGARGGQIDLIAGGAALYPGHVFLRAGTNTDGQPAAVVATVAPTGRLGVNNQAPEHRIHFTGASTERVRIMAETFSEYAGITGRRANGTSAAKTKILNGDAILFMNVHGWTGTQYIAGGQITISADGDWSDTATPSQIVFAPGSPTSPGQATRAVFTSAGKFGFNAPAPAAIFNVTSPTNPTGIGYEIDPDPTNDFVQVRSYDRTAVQYKGYAIAASKFQWGVGTSSAAPIMALTASGNLSVGSTLERGGSGITAIEGRVIVSAASSTTALFIQTGENYSGFKIKAGPATQANGSCDYYDFTTRPGPSGVGNNSDYIMIRMENAVSKNNPDLYLQTSQAGGRVVVGTDSTTNTARLNVIGFTGGGTILNMSGNTAGIAVADMVITRGGATVNTAAGRGSSIQMSNGTNNTHVMFQENDSGLQLYNYVGSVWAERMYMSSNGRFTFGAHASAAGTTAETIQAIGGSTGGNDYCYFAQGATTNPAYAMRMYSSTTSATVGSITFTGSATAYNTSSDRRLKENIVDAPSARDVVDAITVRSFNFKTDGSFWRYGFIAQELNAVAPFAVTVGSDDATEFCQVNGVWAVDNSKLVPALVKAHQEVSSELKETKSQLEETRGEVLALRSLLERAMQRLDVLEGK